MRLFARRARRERAATSQLHRLIVTPRRASLGASRIRIGSISDARGIPQSGSRNNGAYVGLV